MYQKKKHNFQEKSYVKDILNFTSDSTTMDCKPIMVELQILRNVYGTEWTKGSLSKKVNQQARFLRLCVKQNCSCNFS